MGRSILIPPWFWQIRNPIVRCVLWVYTLYTRVSHFLGFQFFTIRQLSNGYLWLKTSFCKLCVVFWPAEVPKKPILEKIIFWTNFLYKFFYCYKLIWQCWFHSGLCFEIFYVFGLFWHICKKSKNKDFGGAIVQNLYVF